MFTMQLIYIPKIAEIFTDILVWYLICEKKWDIIECLCSSHTHTLKFSYFVILELCFFVFFLNKNFPKILPGGIIFKTTKQIESIV